jgi:hypothetical protein
MRIVSRNTSEHHIQNRPFSGNEINIEIPTIENFLDGHDCFANRNLGTESQDLQI